MVALKVHAFIDFVWFTRLQLDNFASDVKLLTTLKHRVADLGSHYMPSCKYCDVHKAAGSV